MFASKKYSSRSKTIYSFKQKKHPNLEGQGDYSIDKIIYPNTMLITQRPHINSGSFQYKNKGIVYGGSNGNK